MTTGIYKLTFSNTQFYIGQAIDCEARYEEHCKKLQKGTHTEKMQRVSDQLNELPGMEVVLDCHEDFLDLFESWLICKYSGALCLNTVIPRDRLLGITQKEMDWLSEHRNLGVVGLLTKYSELQERVLGLKESLEEAETVITKQEQDYMESITKLDTSGIIRMWKEKYYVQRNTAKLLSLDNTYYVNRIKELEHENKHLRSRGFWKRLFNL